jgi:hypothetical protein
MQEYKTQFEIDWYKPMSINGMESNKGYYNLVVTIRDLKLFSRGMKPHRFWRLKDVKHYFGIKGNTKTILKRLEDFRDGNL